MSRKDIKEHFFLKRTNDHQHVLQIKFLARSARKGERKLIKLIFLLHYHEDNANVLKQLTVVYANKTWWCGDVRNVWEKLLLIT